MEQYCQGCGRLLNKKHIKWLELNHQTGTWTDPAKVRVPEEESQGTFPFGIGCAKLRLKPRP